MDRIVREAERTGRAAIEQAYVLRLPKTLTAGPAATRLRHLKLWYCMLPDEALPPFGPSASERAAMHARPTAGEGGHRSSHHEALAADEDLRPHTITVLIVL
jgi:hypothetical protein